MTRRPTRPAFTLFQLLALIALFAFLLGLLLPAVAKIRAAAARAQSTNNLRQIALACHNYASVSNVFPEGCDGNHFSAAARLLPFIEYDNLYKLIDFTKPITDEKNKVAREAVVKVFLNPQDPIESVVKGYAPTSYLFSAGAKYSLTDNDGVFYMNSAVRLPGDIPDGTSNTVLAGETLRGDPKAKPGDLRRSHVALKRGELKKLQDDSGVADFKAGKNIAHDRGAAWIDGRFLKGTFTGTRKVNDPRPDVDCEGEGGLSGLRGLNDGANVAMCDGSARFVLGTTSAATWRLLTCRNDGQPIPNDF
jgi:prepilin-type processing-associated H-X9-DG protein